MASFIEAVLKRKVATICDHVGYNAITKESSNVLVDLYRRTIVHLARHCKEAANNNRRVEPTLIDLIQAYDFVGISIPELKEHAECVKIPFDVKIERSEDDRASNRVQRNLFVDDLLDAEKNIGQSEDNQNGADGNGTNDGADEEDKNMTPLLKDIYQEISTNFPNPSRPITADKLRIKREEKPVIPKLKITPLDPSIAEPPSFLPILGGVKESAAFGDGPHSSPPPPLSEKPKRGRQKGAKLKTKTLKASSSSVKASNKVVAKAKAKSSAAKLKPKLKTKLKTKGKVRQTKTKKQQEETKAPSPELPKQTPSPEPPAYSPPTALASPIEEPAAQIKIKPDSSRLYRSEDALLEAPVVGAESKQSKQKKKKKRSSNQFAIVTETVTAAAAEEEEWLCPNCNGPDNGDLMVGCDQCELWYHLRCTNLKKPPKDDENWLCSRCTGSSSKKAPTPAPPAAQTPTTSAAASTSKSSSKGRKRPPPPEQPAARATKTPDLKHTPTPPPAPKPPALDFTDAPIQNRPTVICTSPSDLCPECQLPDDGTLMIQCDDPFCARWFHGKCVSVLEEPKDDESWFCKVCVDKQQSAFKRRRRAI